LSIGLWATKNCVKKQTISSLNLDSNSLSLFN
jgi:hypothetical protein